MMRRFFIFLVTLALTASFLACELIGKIIYASETGLSKTQHISLVTLDNRPLSIDRLLHVAFSDINYHADISTAHSLQYGYYLANSGERDAVIASTPDMESAYPHLVRVPVVIENNYIAVYRNTSSELVVENWEELSGLKVGILTQRMYLSNSLPSDAIVTEKDNTALLMNGLSQGEYDAVVLSVRAHETLLLPHQVEQAGVIEALPEYLYLNKNKDYLLEPITQSLEAIFADGRGDRILNDSDLSDLYPKQTILHIFSSNTEIIREESLKTRLQSHFKKDSGIEWYTVELNATRFSDDPSRLLYYANLLRRDCTPRHIAAIVISGNDAMRFLKNYYTLFFWNTPVFYYGVDDAEVPEDLSDYFTGINERLSVIETVECALRLFPETKNLLVINDYSSEGIQYRQYIADQLSHFPHLNLTFNANTGRQALQEKLSALSEDSLVLVGSYFLDANKQYYSQNDMAQFMENYCPVPVFSPYSAVLPYDAVGGKVIDYELYGDILADMLTLSLSGEKNIPSVNGSELHRWVFNQEKLDQWDINSHHLPQDAQIINRTPTVWESDPRFAYSMVALMLLGLLTIIAMGLFMVSLRNKNAALLVARQELHTAEELLAKDEKIKEVKDRMERIITTAPVSFLLLADGKVMQLNENTRRALGLQEGDDVAHAYAEIGSRERLYKKLRKDSALMNEVLKIRTVNGEPHRFLINATIVEYEEHPAVSVWAVDIEQTEQEKDQLQTARRDLQSIIDTMPMPAGIASIESDRIMYGNHSFISFMELDWIDNFQGMPFIEVLPPVQSDGTTAAEMTRFIMTTSHSGSRDVQIRTHTGRIIETRNFVCPIEYEGKPSVFSIFSDLSAEKERHLLLEKAAVKEKEANDMKGHFLVNMSHEIRTPMNAIIGLTEIELRKTQFAETMEVYRKINISAKNLLQIVNDIMDISKIEANMMNIEHEEFELEDVLNSALLVASPRLDGKNVEFTLNASLDLPRYIIGDKTRVWQILKNFLDNSAKFTDEGRITLTVASNERYSDDETITITFTVEDTGSGMSEKQLEKIFMPYEQFQSEAQRKYTGTGLGMPISKRLCELMGGVMRIDSTLGIGTKSQITIPFKRSARVETEQQTIASQMLNGVNILAVDDDRFTLDIIAAIIRSSGANCTIARNGREAIKIIYNNRTEGIHFDLILLDYIMDGLNGLETAKQIQASLSMSPKILLVTAYQNQLIKDQIKNSGISEIIEKPIIPTKFIQRLYETMGIQTKNREAEEALTTFKDVTVLVFEDNLFNQEVAAGMFTQLGITPVIVSNGVEGTQLLKERRDFDLIFMDLQMPLMNGYEASGIIRKDKRMDHIPIISLTADAMTDILEKCLAAGMNDHIAKPIAFSSLHKILLKWLPKDKHTAQTIAIKTGAGDPYMEALARFGGDEQALRRAIKEFAQSLPDTWQSLAQAMENESETRSYVHTLKGLAGSLSAMALYHSAVAFEDTLRKGHPDQALYNQLVDEACKYKQTTLLEFEDETAAPLEEGTDAELAVLLDQLEIALEEYDPTETTGAIDALQTKAWPHWEKELQAVYDFASAYSFRKAGLALKDLKEKMGIERS